MTTKNSQTHINIICNGWLFNAQDAINKIYDEIRTMIINRNVSSRVRIFYANEIKSFIEETHQKLIEINVIDNTVHCLVEIKINIDYDNLSESEFYQLKQATKP